MKGVSYIARHKMSRKRGQKEKPRPAINTGNKNKAGLGAKTCSGEGPVGRGFGASQRAIRLWKVKRKKASSDGFQHVGNVQQAFFNRICLVQLSVLPAGTFPMGLSRFAYFHRAAL